MPRYNNGDKLKLTEEGKRTYSTGGTKGKKIEYSDYGIIDVNGDIEFFLDEESLGTYGYDINWLMPFYNIEEICLNLLKLEQKLTNK